MKVRLLTDLRCLQDPGYGDRGVGSHAAFLLDAVRQQSNGAVEIIGLIDPRLQPLSERHRQRCDELRTAFVATDSQQPAVFLELSPMTHNSLLPARLLDQPHVFPATVIYDFIPLEQPDRYLTTSDQRRQYAAAVMWLDAYRAFFPISQHAEAGLANHVDLSAATSCVTGVALRTSFETCLRAQPQSQQANRGDSPTLLFAGGPDSRKNLETVVAAHRQLAASGRGDIELVVVGNYPAGWRQTICQTVGQHAKHIRFLDRVSDEELVGWYQRATVTVSASLAEGFSMPVIEAIACGCPVVASDIPAHRELIASSVWRFPPTDAAVLTQTLRRLFDLPQERRRLAAAQRTTAERFTREAVAERFWSVLEDRFARFCRSRSIHRYRRRAIALVSPFPPDRSGVADYTRRCVESLAERVDVDVYTDQPNPLPTVAVRSFQPISSAAWLRPDYDATVAVLGNSHFHQKIIDLHARFGGPCIMHDNRLADILAITKGIDHLCVLATKNLQRPVSPAEVRQWLADPARLPVMFFDDVIANARPFFVHSRRLQEHVERCYGQPVNRLPFCVYRQGGGEIISEAERNAARDALGVAAGQAMFVSFGIVAENKRPFICLDAIHLLHRRGYDASLIFAGQAGSELRQRIVDRADQLGIKDRIVLTSDWISEPEYRRFIAAADAAIQLRSHFFGGLSGALLDCISFGIPTVANEDLAEACDAPGFVRQVSDAPDGTEIARELEAILSATDDQMLRAEACRSFVANHSFSEYADQLLKQLGLDVVSSSGNRADVAGHLLPATAVISHEDRIQRFQGGAVAEEIKEFAFTGRKHRDNN